MSRSLAAVFAGALLALAQAALADDTKAGGGDEYHQITYAGGYVSRVSADFNNVAAAVNLAFIGGVRIPTIDWISGELKVGFSIIPGKNDNSTSSGGGGNCGGLLQPQCPPNVTQSQDDLQILTIGVFGVVRTPGRLYATGRFGYRYLQSNFDELYDKRSGAEFGGGVGWRWGESLSGIELVYNRVASNIDELTLGIVYGFGR